VPELPTYKNEYSESHLLAVGIDTYTDPRMVPLGNAEADATAVASLLAAPPFSFSTQLLLGKQATKQAVQDALFDMRRTDRDSRVIFFFSGHGYVLTDNFNNQTGYLACADTVANRDHTALELSDVMDFRRHAAAKHILFIFDSCYSGQALGLTKATTATVDQYRLRRTYQVLTAGAGDQEVFDYHSMTQYMITYLSNAAEMITADHLGLHLKDVLARETGGMQIPQYGPIGGGQGGSFILYEPPPVVVNEIFLALPDDLRDGLTDPSAKVRRFAIADAADLLTEPDHRSAVQTALQHLRDHDPNSEVRARADKAIEEFGEALSILKNIGKRHQDKQNQAQLHTSDAQTDRLSQQPHSKEIEQVELPALLPAPFDWCAIPAGRVTLEENAGTFDVHPFWMAKYPITYAQFQVFIDAPDGFYNYRWWQGLAVDANHWKSHGEQMWKIANHPRERVSWWDAVAFTLWLSAKTEMDIRLPTIWEWQWAAQGPDGRRYPWGNQSDPGRCNVEESGIRQTTSVDRYPNGASPYGVLDMSGNVWEWCFNELQKTQNIQRQLRGGSYRGIMADAEVNLSKFEFPDRRDKYSGFRIACSYPSM